MARSAGNADCRSCRAGIFGRPGWTSWLPAFFIRSFDLPVNVVGASVGLASGIGVLIGVVAGSWLTIAANSRGERCGFLWCSVVILAMLRCYALTLWAPSSGSALSGVLCVNVGAFMMLPFIFGEIQGSCDPRFRARAVAVALIVVTICSYALVPVAIGALSDMFNSTQGTNSLKMALNAFLVMPFIAAWIYYHISKRFFPWTDPQPKGFDRGGERIAELLRRRRARSPCGGSVHGAALEAACGCPNGSSGAVFAASGLQRHFRRAQRMRMLAPYLRRGTSKRARPERSARVNEVLRLTPCRDAI